MSTGAWFIGLDVAQSHDFTALAILERAELVGPWDPVVHAYRKFAALHVRYLERLPLGTPGDQIVNRK